MNNAPYKLYTIKNLNNLEEFIEELKSNCKIFLNLSYLPFKDFKVFLDRIKLEVYSTEGMGTIEELYDGFYRVIVTYDN